MESYNTDFWKLVDQLIETSEIRIDRPKASVHPRFPEFIYPVDYGYLDGTLSMDQDGIDIWVGSEDFNRVTAILCTIDIVKRDSEIKLIYNCSDKEIEVIYEFHNRAELMKAIIIMR